MSYSAREVPLGRICTGSTGPRCYPPAYRTTKVRWSAGRCAACASASVRSLTRAPSSRRGSLTSVAPRPEREKPASGSSDAGSMAMPFRSQILERVTRMPAETGTAPRTRDGPPGARSGDSNCPNETRARQHLLWHCSGGRVLARRGGRGGRRGAARARSRRRRPRRRAAAAPRRTTRGASCAAPSAAPAAAACAPRTRGTCATA
mmetsp:Transcript_21779/g.71083  ORF Transcript_21779/g.71083 Transcript_21779/m.71083 type:complete len:205 (+) Transcript_21779:514-1128(+)